MGNEKRTLKLRRRPNRREILINGLPFLKILLVDSRLWVVFVVQCLSNYFIPDHDADAFRSVPWSKKLSFLDTVVDTLFSGFRRWDAVHFIHIAQYGYTFENNLAFFPLYPVMVQLVTKVWYSFIPQSFLQPTNALLLSGIVINLVCFVGSGYILCLLTWKLFGSRTVSYLALILFALNPASIFFSSCYSESLFSFLSWLGLLCLYGGNRSSSWVRVLEASVCFSLALLTRSNGLLNCGFIVHVVAGNFLTELLSKERRILRLISSVLLALSSGVVIIIPYLYHQYGIYKQFCSPMVPFVPYSVQKVASEQDYILPGQLNKLLWCNKTVPFSYSAIQSRYWEVGFLRYFQMRKLPCFLLALPVAVVSLAACLRFLAHLKPWRTFWIDLIKDDQSFLPFCVHSMFLCVFGICFTNVEVLTRILFSASPLLYWYAAVVLKESMGDVEIPLRAMTELRLCSAYKSLWGSCKGWRAKLMIAYFASYAVIGTCLHANFYPWT